MSVRPPLVISQRRRSSLLPPCGVPLPFLEGGAGEIDVDVTLRAAIAMTINSRRLSVTAFITYINDAAASFTRLSTTTSACDLRVVNAALPPAANVGRPVITRVSVPPVVVITSANTAVTAIAITTRASPITSPVASALVAAPTFPVPAPASHITVRIVVTATALIVIGTAPAPISTTARI